MCGRQRARVDVDRVPARRLARSARRPRTSSSPRYCDRADAVAQVVLVEHLREPRGDRLEVAAGEAAVGREALGEDQQVARSARRQRVVVHGEEAADVGEAVLLGAASCSRRRGENISRAISFGVRPRLARLALLDEPGVLGEAAGVEEEAACRSRSQSARTPRRFSSDTGWPPPELLVTVTITSGTRAAVLGEQAPRAPSRSMLPLNGCTSARDRAPRGSTRSTASAPATSMLARVVSKWVLLGTTSPGCRIAVEQDALGGAALVRRDDVLEAGDVAAPTSSKR